MKAASSDLFYSKIHSGTEWSLRPRYQAASISTPSFESRNCRSSSPKQQHSSASDQCKKCQHPEECQGRDRGRHGCGRRLKETTGDEASRSEFLRRQAKSFAMIPEIGFQAAFTGNGFRIYGDDATLICQRSIGGYSKLSFPLRNTRRCRRGKLLISQRLHSGNRGASQESL